MNSASLKGVRIRIESARRTVYRIILIVTLLLLYWDSTLSEYTESSHHIKIYQMSKLPVCHGLKSILTLPILGRRRDKLTKLSTL